MRSCSKSGGVLQEPSSVRWVRRALPSLYAPTNAFETAAACRAGGCAECGEPIADSGSIRYCPRCVERYAGRSTAYSRDLRTQVLRAYSNGSPRCACCAEANLLFLTLDHTDKGGRAHRLRQGTQGVFRQVKRDGFPIGFRVLCFNCNLACGFYGTCPHEAADIAAAPDMRQSSKPVSCLVSGAARDASAACLAWPSIQTRVVRAVSSHVVAACTREASIERLRVARREAMAHYSGGEVRCQCCGEREEMFLALDHIGGQGPRQPGRRTGGNSFYTWLSKQGYPPGLRVFCHNCNCAMGKNRKCPHAIPSVERSSPIVGTAAIAG